MYRFLGSIVLGLSLLTPAGILQAQDHHDEQMDHHDQQMDHHDQHQWSDSENPSWHQYLKEHHKRDHDWDRASKREKADYWKWRDQHR